MTVGWHPKIKQLKSQKNLQMEESGKHIICFPVWTTPIVLVEMRCCSASCVNQSIERAKELNQRFRRPRAAIRMEPYRSASVLQSC